ncbi:MAG: hypothetical protein MZV63_26765 [Marinilabiliales bacterium]|nr:hypothetical protein [Marinilabiliales bacterium]
MKTIRLFSKKISIIQLPSFEIEEQDFRDGTYENSDIKVGNYLVCAYPDEGTKTYKNAVTWRDFSNRGYNPLHLSFESPDQLIDIDFNLIPGDTPDDSPNMSVFMTINNNRGGPGGPRDAGCDNSAGKVTNA